MMTTSEYRQQEGALFQKVLDAMAIYNRLTERNGDRLTVREVDRWEDAKFNFIRSQIKYDYFVKNGVCF